MARRNWGAKVVSSPKGRTRMVAHKTVDELREELRGIYTTPEDRDRVLQAYVRAGVSRGDKCVVALDEADPQGLLAGLGEAADVGHWLTSGQLDVRTTPPTQSESGLTVPDMQAAWDALWPTLTPSQVAILGSPEEHRPG